MLLGSAESVGQMDHLEELCFFFGAVWTWRKRHILQGVCHFTTKQCFNRIWWQAVCYSKKQRAVGLGLKWSRVCWMQFLLLFEGTTIITGAQSAMLKGLSEREIIRRMVIFGWRSKDQSAWVLVEQAVLNVILAMIVWEDNKQLFFYVLQSSVQRERLAENDHSSDNL